MNKRPDIIKILNKRLQNFIINNPLEWKQFTDNGIVLEYDDHDISLTIKKATSGITLIRFNYTETSRIIQVKLNTMFGTGDVERDWENYCDIYKNIPSRRLAIKQVSRMPPQMIERYWTITQSLMKILKIEIIEHASRKECIIIKDIDHA